MPDLFQLLSQYFWLVALAFCAFNYWKADHGARSTIAPAKLEQAKACLRWFAAAAALPWLIMGAGQLSGATPTVLHYFRPQDGNPYVLSWFAVTFAVSLLFAWWVFLHDGARKVVEFNLLTALGQRGAKPSSENMVKVFAVLGIVLFPLLVFLLVSMDTPLLV